MRAIYRRLGACEIQFLAWVQGKRITTLRTGQAAAALDLTAKQERELLSRLARNGFVLRLQRGLYLLPPTLPGTGKQRWTPDLHTILNALMGSLDAQYQIGGLMAFQFHGFNRNTPETIHVYNNYISGKRTIGATRFHFIKVADARLGGESAFQLTNQSTVRITNPARTLLDAVYDYHRYQTLPQAYRWITKQERNQALIQELVEMSLRFGNQATHRRLGYIIDSMHLPHVLTQPLHDALTSQKSLIPLVPEQRGTGRVNVKWGVIENLPPADE